VTDAANPSVVASEDYASGQTAQKTGCDFTRARHPASTSKAGRSPRRRRSPASERCCCGSLTPRATDGFAAIRGHGARAGQRIGRHCAGSRARFCRDTVHVPGHVRARGTVGFRGSLTVGGYSARGDARTPAAPAGSGLADGQDDPYPHGRAGLHALSLQLGQRTVRLPHALAPERQLPVLARGEQAREGAGRVGANAFGGAGPELSAYLVLVVPFPLRVSGIAKSGGGVLGIGFGRGGFSGIGTDQSRRSARRSIALPRHPARPRRPRTSG
jgi:hypothetical protein